LAALSASSPRRRFPLLGGLVGFLAEAALPLRSQGLAPVVVRSVLLLVGVLQLLLVLVFLRVLRGLRGAAGLLGGLGLEAGLLLRRLGGGLLAVQLRLQARQLEVVLVQLALRVAPELAGLLL
jgi:hypothetical protein